MKWFCKHDWSKWSELIEPYGISRQQWRCCNKCGILRKRNLGYCNGVNQLRVNSLFKGFFGTPKKDK